MLHNTVVPLQVTVNARFTRWVYVTRHTSHDTRHTTHVTRYAVSTTSPSHRQHSTMWTWPTPPCHPAAAAAASSRHHPSRAPRCTRALFRCFCLIFASARVLALLTASMAGVRVQLSANAICQLGQLSIRRVPVEGMRCAQQHVQVM